MKFLCNASKILIVILFTKSIPSCESLKEGQPNVCRGVKQSIDIQGRIVELIDLFCCSGFEEKDDKCIECVECTQEESCPEGFCGKRCTSRCADCPPWTTCHPEYCCTCPEGFTGHYCNQTCDQGYFGMNCTHYCKCSEQSSCDVVSGSCTCGAGWTGKYCDEACDQGYFGINCTHRCTCSEHSSCDAVSGRCKCNSGWTGRDCDKVDFNSSICVGNCECDNSKCDPYTGECQCVSENSTSYVLPTDTGGQHDRNDVFIYIITFIVTLAAFSMVACCISVVKVIKKNKNIYLHTNPAAEAVLPGHYDEINPYSEISPNDLDELRQPYYSSPLEVETIRKTRSEPFIKLFDNTFPETINDRSKDTPIYLSLPNLSEYSHILNPYVSLETSTNNRRYDSLQIKSGKFKRSGYVHPYNTLTDAKVNIAGYIHPYSSIPARPSTSNKNDSFDYKVSNRQMMIHI